MLRNPTLNILAGFSISVMLLFFGCEPGEGDLQELRGETMGTLYSLKWADDAMDAATLREGMEAVFNRYNSELSNWDSSSWVSTFNQRTDTNWVELPSTALQVFKDAQEFHQLSGGAFDVTLSPIIELWGFGSSKPTGIPSEKAIEQALSRIGMDRLELDVENGRIRKLISGLEVNCSAVAKGHAVDDVADWLLAQGITNFLFEIGGELRSSGQPPGKPHWTVGIRKPSRSSGGIQHKLTMNEAAMATSGDYYNYTEVAGVSHSHIIDPQSGRPVNHTLCSVTITGARCAKADALATACLVMGTSQALALIESISGYEAYLVERHADGSFHATLSSGF